MKILSLRLNVSQVLVDFFILFRAKGCVDSNNYVRKNKIQ